MRAKSLFGKDRGMVPAHFDAEVLVALRRMVLRRLIQPARAAEALSDAVDLPFERAALAPLLAGAFALRDRCAAPDALYVVLAQRVDATLVTSDGRLAAGAQGLVRIELIS